MRSFDFNSDMEGEGSQHGGVGGGGGGGGGGAAGLPSNGMLWILYVVDFVWCGFCMVWILYGVDFVCVWICMCVDLYVCIAHVCVYVYCEEDTLYTQVHMVHCTHNSPLLSSHRHP